PCRAAIAADERRDAGPAHRVVPLHATAGRGQLLDEVWGPRERRGTRPTRPDHMVAALALAPLLVGMAFAFLAVHAGSRLDWVSMAGVFPLVLMLAVPTLGYCLQRIPDPSR